jgi:hypothetical protein
LPQQPFQAILFFVILKRLLFLKVDFTGKAPYTFTYSNGDEEVTVENVTKKSYGFTTPMRGTVELVSMKEVDGFGITRLIIPLKLNRAFRSN